eukprot:TRINITY_DN44574_c0_g1_i2.p1 TRINITY_DN44574_c0_g1~~TRINITY_DN44574_c0_g1_i2.p1  ORF type:complete len:667 (-),score=85.80 TRINITY_DN44574_c0_g1_i2:180-2180(-)
MWRLLPLWIVDAADSASLGSTPLHDGPLRQPYALGPDCAVSVALSGRQEGSLSVRPRIVPARGDVPSGESNAGFLLGMQDRDTITLDWRSGSCHGDATLEVNSSEDFFNDPHNSGLHDVVQLVDDRVAVVWILNSIVWVRVVSRPTSSLAPPSSGASAPPRSTASATSDPMQASSSTRHRRSQALVVANPASPASGGGGFVVAWSSWGQDGDGWGVYARAFDSNVQPLGEEILVNTRTDGFQWQPQLAWCGDPHQCVPAPVARHLTTLGDGTGTWSWRSSPEVVFGTGSSTPMASALTCHRDDSNATVVWVEDGGLTVSWNHTGAGPAGNQETGRLSRQAGLLPQPVDGPFASLVSAAADLHEAVLSTVRGSPAKMLTESAVGPVESGEWSVMADKGTVVIMWSDGQSVLRALLVEYESQRPLWFQDRAVAVAAHSARAVLDVTSPHNKDLEALRGRSIFCWVISSEDPDPDSSSGRMVCEKRQVQWLVNAGSLDWSSSMAALFLFCTVGAFVWLRHCMINGCFRARRNVGTTRRVGLSGVAARTRAGRSGSGSLSQSRQRELRQQLAAIRESPPSPPPPCPQGGEQELQNAAVAQAGGSNGTSSMRTSDLAQSCCQICHNEVTVRVALQRCGHTACRECVGRLVDLNQRCHICRGVIDGVLPVYI